jgi:hypothetical protein
MMNGCAAACVVIGTLMWVASSSAAVSIGIGRYSQQVAPGQAQAGGSITVTSSRPGSASTPGASSAPGPSPSAEGTGPQTSGSPSHVEPLGQGSYRYTGAGGEECLYLTEGINTCAGEEEARPAAPAAPARPAVNPEAVAVTVSARLNLAVGGIVASPSAQTAGLTGAASWFWLEPTPAARSVSVSLRGELVTVSASVASVRWSFGDESDLVAGAGVPYRPGTPPAGAVRHVYQTRCLPGDQGHDPNVLSSCGPNGYRVEALVKWAISYTASGPVAVGGPLPARSTETSISYPVSEARAFLTGEGER